MARKQIEKGYNNKIQREEKIKRERRKLPAKPARFKAFQTKSSKSFEAYSYMVLFRMSLQIPRALCYTGWHTAALTDTQRSQFRSVYRTADTFHN